MDILQFKSEDERITIKVATSADNYKLWRRFSSRVGDTEKAKIYCDYISTIPGTLKLESGAGAIELDRPQKDFKGLPPVFYETATYNFSILFKDLSEPPRILHQLKEISELFTAVKIGESQWMLTAPLDFLNEPGIFELKYRYRPIGEPERTDTFSFRVVSPKLDAKEDYQHILEVINQEYNEIVFQYLTKTFQNLTRGGHSDNDVVWLSIFRDIIEQYIKAVHYIVNRPHLTETHNVAYSHADRIKHWTPGLARKFVERRADGSLERSYFRNETTEYTNNTRENRFVKFTIERISRRLGSVINSIRLKASEKNIGVAESEMDELNAYQGQLRKFANAPLLRKLKAEPLHSESMVLQKRTGYAQVYRYWIMLQKGIELYEGHNNIGTRPIWELYELWCFLKMRKMVAEILALDFANPEEITETPTPMLEPFSDSSVEHTIQYFYEGDEVSLHYQHTYNRTSGDIHTATTDNRPDIVLSIHKPDGFELTYLYDAKYRVNDDDKLSTDDEREQSELGARGADYPPSDAINQMHRYRDAIYYGERQSRGYTNSAKEIIGGYILFPGRGDDEAIKKRYYFKSIESVNIGAFPLLPDHANPENEGTLLREHLTSILLNQTAYQQIKDSIPQRGLVYSPTLADTNDLVLVGYYKTEQLPIILEKKLYYVPAALGKGSINLVSGFEATKYLLLHHGSDRNFYELDGNGPKFFPATVLREMGFEPSGDYYLGFTLKSTTPIEIEGIDPKAISLPPRRQQYTPFFATFKSLK